MDIFDLIFARNKNPRGPERRKSARREFKGVDRRQNSDRRGLVCGLAFTTSRHLAPIEEWLADTFPESHRFNIEGMSDDLSAKHVRVLLSSPEDRDTFREFLNRYLKEEP